MSYFNVPPLYKDNDIVYHYTSTELALKFILNEMKLRLNPRSLSNDPIENTEHFFIYSSYNTEKGITENALKLTKNCKEKIRAAKQLCFCKNNLKNPNSNTHYSFENYGFAKPRMWDQYGNNYKGVCLAFSMKQLIENGNDIGAIGQDVKYIKYSESEESHRSIDIELCENDFDNYNLKFENHIIKRLFEKHIDYVNENEFRMISFSEKYYDYIDINGALKGIIISNLGINSFLYESINENIKSKNTVDVQILNFNNQTLHIESYEKYKELFKKFKSYIIKR